MNHLLNQLCKCVVILLAVVPVMLFANAGGPPARHTSAPGDIGSCTACHTGSASATGLEITAAESDKYTPGQQQRMTVTIPTGTARLFGFQASVRLLSDLTNGQAGTLAPSNGETRVICADDGNPPCRATAAVQFIEHSNAKSGNTFEFNWTPPATDVGQVRFYVAANAANGDGNNTGDRIYITTLTLSPNAASGPAPSIRSNGVENAATFEANIVSSSWATIKGENLAQTTRIWAGSDFQDGRAPTTLDGVKVNIDGKPASIYYISPTQINVQAPPLDKTGPVAVEVVTTNGTSNTASVEVRRAAPGWFMFAPENNRYIAGTHTDSTATFLGKPGLFGAAVTSRPAAPGNEIILYGANFGPTNPVIPDGRAVAGLSPLTDAPTVTVGGVNARVTYGGGAPAQIATYQFNIIVPDVPNGDHEVVATLGGVRTQQSTFITVQR